jgi:mRNA interferase RelE/StbE
MKWQIKFKGKSKKQLDKLDKESRDKILKYLYKTVSNLQHPNQLGKALRNNLKGCWRYRVNKFRIICELQEGELIVLVLKVAQRDIVYED